MLNFSKLWHSTSILTTLSLFHRRRNLRLVMRTCLTQGHTELVSKPGLDHQVSWLHSNLQSAEVPVSLGWYLAYVMLMVELGSWFWWSPSFAPDPYPLSPWLTGALFPVKPVHTSSSKTGVPNHYGNAYWDLMPIDLRWRSNAYWDLMPIDLRWSWCNNNRNKVHKKYAWIIPKPPPLPQSVWKLSSTKLVPGTKMAGNYCSKKP